MDICLIRHAEPDWMPGGRHKADPGLTERGHDQARRLGERAASWPAVNEIWVSPARRSQETAAPLVEALAAPATTYPWLLEAQGPNLEGKTVPEMRAFFKGKRRRPTDAWWSGLEGGESMRDFTARIAEGFDEVLAQRGATRRRSEPHWEGLPDHRRIVVVSHAGTSATALAHLLGVPAAPWSWERFRLGHAGMIVVRSAPIAEGQIFGLHTFNDRQHLPVEMHTI